MLAVFRTEVFVEDVAHQINWYSHETGLDELAAINCAD